MEDFFSKNLLILVYNSHLNNIGLASEAIFCLKHLNSTSIFLRMTLKNQS